MSAHDRRGAAVIHPPRPVTVPFAGCRLRHATIAWSNDPDGGAASGLLAGYAYAAPGGASFPPEAFDLADMAGLLAEGYGGDGLAGNGGGARAGLRDGILVKGCGRNPLVGRDADPRHAYGALYLEHALAEAVSAQLIDIWLPLGSVPVVGVVNTGVAVDFTDAAGVRHRGPGGLLLREACLRPAHFLPAPGFVSQAARGGVPDDRQRVRLMMAHYADRRGRDRFEALLYDFLGGCAVQFGAARAASLAHGSLSASNIALDGRWLDLSHASLLPPGCNVKFNPNQPSFLREAMAPIDIALQLAYQFGKHCGRPIGEAALARHFDLSFRAAHDRALLRRAGLDVGEGVKPPVALGRLMTRIVAGSRTISLSTAGCDDGPDFDALTDAYRTLLRRGADAGALAMELRALVAEAGDKAGLAPRASTFLALFRAWARHHAFLLLERDDLVARLRPILTDPPAIARLADELTGHARGVWRRDDGVTLHSDAAMRLDYLPAGHRLMMLDRRTSARAYGTPLQAIAFLADRPSRTTRYVDRLRALLEGLDGLW